MADTTAVPLPQTPYSLYYEWPDDEDGYGGSEVVDANGYTADQMHSHAAAVSAAKDAEIAGLRDVLQFIAGHDLDGADDRARAIICGLFIIKAKKALAARAALGDKS